MNIQGYQKLTLLDFPGYVACTVFTGGCNLRCPFCHNFELATKPNASENLEKEVFDYLKKRQGMLDGVCITGGEPMLQTDLEDFILRVKEMGFLVKLDTNGTFPERLKVLLDKNLLDYVAMDIKSSYDTYSLLCGVEVDTDKIKQSIELLEKSGVEHEFRTTAVKGLHTISDFEKIGRMLSDTQRYFIQRFVMNEAVPNADLDAFSDGEMLEILKTVKKTIPNAQIRG